MQLEIAALSKVGGRTINEDACGVWSSPDACFCVLSDGAGGHGGGDVASKLVVSRVLNWFRQHPECTAEAVETALFTANQAVVESQASDQRLSDMRATVVILAIDTASGLAIWGHLGDTRLYCFRDQRVVVQTRDHSVVQNMVDAGYIKQSQLRGVPQRGRLLSAIGDVENFSPSVKQDRFSLTSGDVFLLCTDGCWEHVEETEMERSLGESKSSEEWLRQIEAKVLAAGKSQQDNYSALAVWCSDPAEHQHVRYAEERY
ncbi:MAG: PP2C family serine/threonine-protein phosphatase [Pseudomonadota bacterium]